jgi:hypothetical protein
MAGPFRVSANFAGSPAPRPACADRLWIRLSKHFARANLARYHGEGPTHYIRRVKAAYPSVNLELDAFLEAYIAINYREYTRRNMYLSKMKSLLHQIKLSLPLTRVTPAMRGHNPFNRTFERFKSGQGTKR